MKIFRQLLSASVIVALAVSCSDKAQIRGILTDAPQTEVVVKQLSGNSFNVLDTLVTDDEGAYSYRMPLAKGQPEFVYLFKGDTRIASLILLAGDKVQVVSDTLGKYSVEGSEESARLREVENEFAAFLGRMNAAAEAGDNAALTREYISYYRSRVAYVIGNPASLSSIPVLYQKINENFPVFSQSTDALHFQSVHDALAQIYPESKYVAALADEAKRRTNLMSLDMQIKDIQPLGFPDVELPSVEGEKVRLSEVDAKVILVYFWTASDVTQKMFNQDALIPVYNDFHKKGFEIYSISLDVDKGIWASAVNSQDLPWINVCDGLGVDSPAARNYNVSGLLPVAFVIIDGTLSDKTIQGEKELRSLLSANLK
ncbi:MAG: redoxin domain-containing protein [Candidatus Cryptobacteroides sp.]